VQQHYPDVVIYRQTNHGVSHARNRGIELASSNWIALLDSDDSWYPGKLAAQLKALTDQPQCRLCHTDEHWVRDGNRVNQRLRHTKRGGFIFKHCLPLCAISPSAAMIHRSLFTELGGFDESLPACEDYDFWLRVTAVEPVAYCDVPLVIKYGGHKDQLSRRFIAMDRFRLQALHNILAAGKLTKENELAAIETLANKFRVYASGSIISKHECADI